MQFSTIYYLTICAPTIEKSLKMIDEYVDHGARDFQLDIPSENPVFETELVKAYMRGALEQYVGYDPYLNALRTVRKRHEDINLHLVLYTDVIHAIGIGNLREFVDENRIASIMVAGGDSGVLADLRMAGIPTIERIDRTLNDEQLRQFSAYSGKCYLNLNYKRHSELQPHGCVSFKEKVDYIRNAGVRARILAVEGISSGQMMREVRESGVDGALLGNALMRLWNDEKALWDMFETFQEAAQCRIENVKGGTPE